MKSNANDASLDAKQLVSEARNGWPRWRNSACKQAPRWFKGHELDLLTPHERFELFESVWSARPQLVATQAACVAILTPTAIRGFSDPHTRPVTMGVGILLLVAWCTVPIARRYQALRRAREQVRNSADWPLRLERVRNTA